MGQTLILGELSDSPSPHRMWLQLYQDECNSKCPYGSIDSPCLLLFPLELENFLAHFQGRNGRFEWQG